MKTLKIRKNVVPDLIFFTAQRSENISFYIFTSENITFLKYAFYFINNSPQLAFYVNLHRAVIGPSATLTGR